MEDMQCVSPEITKESHTQLLQLRCLLRDILPNPMKSPVTDELEGKRCEGNHTGSGFKLSTSSAERHFCVLPWIPTSGLSLCVFTESTPKYTDSTLHPEEE